MKTLFKIILSLTFFFCSMNISALDPLRFGVKVGLNLSDYAGDMKDNDMKAGYTAGITVDYQINRSFHLLSGVEVSSKGTREELKNVDQPDIWKVKQQWNPLYLQIPLHIGYTVRAAEDMLILLHAGPFVSYGIGGKV